MYGEEDGKTVFHPLRSLNAKYPFEWLAFDFFGPFPMTTRGSTIGILVVDI